MVSSRLATSPGFLALGSLEDSAAVASTAAKLTDIPSAPAGSNAAR